MSLLWNWRSYCVAVCLAVLAFPSVLTGQTVIEMDYGEVSGRPGVPVHLVTKLTATAYAGCLNAGVAYTLRKPFGGALTLTPSTSTQRVIETIWDSDGLDVQAGAPAHGNSTPVNGTITAVWMLYQGNNKVDEQFVTVNIKGIIKGDNNAPAGTIWDRRTKHCVLTLKPGGPGEGKIRLPQLPEAEEEPEEPEPEEEIDIFTDNTDFAIEPGTGRVLENPIPSYDFGNGRTGKFPNGAGWTSVKVPSSQLASNGIPAALLAAYPGAGRLDSSGIGGTGRPSFMASNRKVGGQARAPFTGGTVTTAQDGSTHITGWGEGNAGGAALRFPPGYERTNLDEKAEEAPEEIPSIENLDDCFGFAALMENYPDAPTNPLPGGMTRGTVGLPPGMTEGGPSLPPGMQPNTGGGLPMPPGMSPNPGLPSTGGNGGTDGGPGGGGLLGGGGGQPPTPPPPPEPDPDPDPEPGDPEPGPNVQLPTGPAGGPLPDVGAAESEADAMARGLSNRVGQVEQRARGLMNWGQIVQFDPGKLGDWHISMPISGHNYTMVIPTDHAPTIRALLLLMISCLFIIATFRLLLS